MYIALQGAKPVPLLLSIAIGAALRFLVPIPEGITVQAWTLLSIFVSTITGKMHCTLDECGTACHSAASQQHVNAALHPAPAHTCMHALKLNVQMSNSKYLLADLVTSFHTAAL